MGAVRHLGSTVASGHQPADQDHQYRGAAAGAAAPGTVPAGDCPSSGGDCPLPARDVNQKGPGNGAFPFPGDQPRFLVLRHFRPAPASAGLLLRSRHGCRPYHRTSAARAGPAVRGAAAVCGQSVLERSATGNLPLLRSAPEKCRPDPKICAAGNPPDCRARRLMSCTRLVVTPGERPLPCRARTTRARRTAGKPGPSTPTASTSRGCPW